MVFFWLSAYLSVGAVFAALAADTFLSPQHKKEVYAKAKGHIKDRLKNDPELLKAWEENPKLMGTLQEVGFYMGVATGVLGYMLFYPIVVIKWIAEDGI